MALANCDDLGIAEHPAIDPQVLHRGAVQTRRVVPLGNFQRDFGADRALQLVGHGLDRLRHAVEIDFRGRRPCSIRRKLSSRCVHSPTLSVGVGHDLQGVVGPGVDEMGVDATVFHAQVPAAKVVLVVHAGDDARRFALPASA